MGDLDYQNYQNLSETLMGSAHEGTVAQYASIINDPEQLGQHLLGDAGSFLLHDKIADGIKGVGKALSFSEADVTGLLGEIGDGASSAVGALGRLSKNIKGAINDRFGNYAKLARGHTAPENTAMNSSQDLTAEEAVARLPGGRTHGLLPFERERPDDEFDSPNNPDAPSGGGGASNPSADAPSATDRPVESSDLDKLTDEEASSLFDAPPPPTGGQDMQNAPDPSGDTSSAEDANARNQADQEGRKVVKDVEKGDEDLTEDDPELAPITAVIGVGALIGSFLLHPHQEKQVAPASAGSNYSLQVGA